MRNQLTLTNGTGLVALDSSPSTGKAAASRAPVLDMIRTWGGLASASLAFGRLVLYDLVCQALVKRGGLKVVWPRRANHSEGGGRRNLRCRSGRIELGIAPNPRHG